jgi:hypothetical protein
MLLPAAEQVAKGMNLAEIFAKHADDNPASKAAFESAGYDFLQKTKGSYLGQHYAATYVKKDISGEGLALRDVPLFNGSNEHTQHARIPDEFAHSTFDGANVIPFAAPERN